MKKVVPVSCRDGSPHDATVLFIPDGSAWPGASGRVLCPAVLSECSLTSLGDSGALSFGLAEVLLVEVLLVGSFCGSSLPQAATRVMLAQAMMAAARLIGVTVGAFLGWLILGFYYFLM